VCERFHTSGTGPSTPRLAMAAAFKVPKQLVTPLRECAVCEGSLSITSDKPVKATCYDVGGAYDLEHVIKECCRMGVSHEAQLQLLLDRRQES
jgi:hypothetical protein